MRPAGASWIRTAASGSDGKRGGLDLGESRANSPSHEAAGPTRDRSPVARDRRPRPGSAPRPPCARARVASGSSSDISRPASQPVSMATQGVDSGARPRRSTSSADGSRGRRGGSSSRSCSSSHTLSARLGAGDGLPGVADQDLEDGVLPRGERTALPARDTCDSRGPGRDRRPSRTAAAGSAPSGGGARECARAARRTRTAW